MQSIKMPGLVTSFIAVAALYAPSSNAQTNIYNTVADGNWTASSTWQNGASGRPPTSGNCDCIININPGHRVTINQNINISNAQIVLHGNGSEIRFSSEIIFAQTMQLTGTSSIELRHSGASIQSTSNLFGYNGNSISINGTPVFQGYSIQVNSSNRGVVSGPASASSSMSPPAFVNALLPLKLVAFGVNEYRGQSMLTWKAIEQVNVDRFEIERSVNEKDWVKIGTVPALETTRGILRYSFTDKWPAGGTNSYRLKIIDADSQFEYSKIVTTTIPVKNVSVKIYPNPAISVMHISCNRAGLNNYNIKLIDYRGHVVYIRTYLLSAGKISLDVGALKPGNYFLEIAGENFAVRKTVVIINPH